MVSAQDAFLHFAEAQERILDARGEARRIALASEYLASVPDAARPHALRLLSGDPAPPRIAPRVIHDLVLALTPWDEFVYAACRDAGGDLGETAARLFAITPPRRRAEQSRLLAFTEEMGATAPVCFTLADACAALDGLAVTPRAEGQTRLLEEAWARMTPVEVRHFTRLVTGATRGRVPRIVLAREASRGQPTKAGAASGSA